MLLLHYQIPHPLGTPDVSQKPFFVFVFSEITLSYLVLFNWAFCNVNQLWAEKEEGAGEGPEPGI